MRTKKTDPELPIFLPFEPGPASNGEYVPRDRSLNEQRAAALAMESAERWAKKLNVDRRQFLVSMGGLAVTLGAINAACGSDSGDGGGATATPGGTFEVPTEPSAEACVPLEGDEFIFDIQTHHVNPDRPPGQRVAGAYQFLNPCDDIEGDDCFGRYAYMKDIFFDSDTTVAVLSDTPSASDERDPLTFEEMQQTLEIMDMLSSGGASRVLLHSIVVPNIGRLEDQLDAMQARAETLDVAAWKVYTPYEGGTGQGWSLDDEEFGIPMIEKARETGVKRICAHKGLPLFGNDATAWSPRDIGVVARMFPDVQFVVYHSGWDPDRAEGPYDPDNAEIGVNSLIKSLEDNDISPNSNVWAELGSTWRGVMSNPTQAAHTLGKLLRYVGEERVCWGTDCIWYGAPQPQIVAFRTFQFDPELAQAEGYPELTAELKAKVFGLNSASLYDIDPEALRCDLDADVVEEQRNLRLEMRPETHERKWTANKPISRRSVLSWFGGQAWSPWR
jgi:predicted TIM-barrel fold metal-dependent hydrolase